MTPRYVDLLGVLVAALFVLAIVLRVVGHIDCGEAQWNC